jgi:hypothetical protein
MVSSTWQLAIICFEIEPESLVIFRVNVARQGIGKANNLFGIAGRIYLSIVGFLSRSTSESGHSMADQADCSNEDQDSPIHGM